LENPTSNIEEHNTGCQSIDSKGHGNSSTLIGLTLLIKQVFTPPRDKFDYLLAQIVSQYELHHRWLLRGIGNVASILTMWAALSIVRSIALILISHLFTSAAKWSPIQQAAILAPGDDLHALIALNMLGGIQDPKLSARLPGIELLQQIIPDWLAPATWLPVGTWFGTIFAPGSSIVGIHTARILLNITFIIIGVALTSVIVKKHGSRSLSLWTRPAVFTLFLGLMIQSYGVAAQLRLSWGDDSGGGILLSMVSTKVLSMGHDTYRVFTSGWLLSNTANIIILATAFALALSLTNILRIKPPAEQGTGPARISPFLVLSGRLAGPLTLVLAVIMFHTPLTHISSFEPAISYASQFEEDARLYSDTQIQGLPIALKPGIVTIVETSNGFEYRVNGVKTCVKGVGYNAMTKGIDPVSRADRYERDFGLISMSGFNTIIGWSSEEFDELLLEKAAQYQLGVVLPFELNPKSNYQDPEVRKQLMEQIKLWVERYKESPAIRMWGVGNEVVHGMGNSRSNNAKAFASFLVEAADYIHSLDPYHPVIYRDAEDSYLEPIAKALEADGISRPWLVYGMNFFTYRIDQALKNGPATRLKQPLLISEFGPVGLRGADRPKGYLKQWGIIRSYKHRVLGASAYVWTTEGPEPLDRAFGLTNADGMPVDESLSAMAQVLREED